MPFEYVRARLQSQNVSDSGIFENLIEVQIRRFEDAQTEARLTKYAVILSTDLKLVIGIQFVPNHVQRYYVSMTIDIIYDSAEDIWASINSQAYDSEGHLFDEFDNNHRYLLVLEEVPWTVPEIVSLQTARQHEDRVLVDDTLTFTVSAFFRMTSPQFLNTPFIRTVKAKLKDLIHNAAFGDNAFVVGGVAFFIDKSTLIRYYEHFEATFRYFEARDEIPYELPNTYPQTFEQVVIDCYMAEMDLPNRNEVEALLHLDMMINEYDRRANILAR